MRIGLDLDGVVFDFVSKMHELIPDIPENPHEVDVYQYVPKDKQALFNSLMTNPALYMSLKMFKGFKEILTDLNKHDIVIISARPKQVHFESLKQVANAGINFIDYVFTHKKGKAMEDKNLDVLVEDQAKYAKQVHPSQNVIMPERSYNNEYLIAEAGDNVCSYTKPKQIIEILNELGGQHVR